MNPLGAGLGQAQPLLPLPNLEEAVGLALLRARVIHEPAQSGWIGGMKRGEGSSELEKGARWSSCQSHCLAKPGFDSCHGLPLIDRLSPVDCDSIPIARASARQVRRWGKPSVAREWLFDQLRPRSLHPIRQVNSNRRRDNREEAV